MEKKKLSSLANSQLLTRIIFVKDVIKNPAGMNLGLVYKYHSHRERVHRSRIFFISVRFFYTLSGYQRS